MSGARSGDVSCLQAPALPLLDAGRLRRFVLSFVSMFVILASAVILMNYVVDPYCVFGVARIGGFNARKPTAGAHPHLAKTFQIERALPTTVLLGTSRVELGIDPQNPRWAAHQRPVYNYSIALASPELMVWNLREAIALGTVRTVVAGLDVEQFLTSSPPTGAAGLRREHMADENLRRVRASADFRIQRAKDVFYSLVSWQATADSIRTLMAQDRTTGTIDEDGSMPEEAIANWVTAVGQAEVFEDKNAIYRKLYQRSHMEIAADSRHMQAVRDLVALCHENRLELVLFITPIHADRIRLMVEAGLWTEVLSWKRQLAEIVMSYPGRDGSGARLVDFGYASLYTSADIDPTSGKPIQPWFWDSSHFRRTLGDKILSGVLDAGPTEFGVRLAAPDMSAAVRQR